MAQTKENLERKIKVILKNATPFANFYLDENKDEDLCQKIKMKSDHSRNLDTQQNNHHRYKIYSSGDNELYDIAGNYLAKTSEKVKNKVKPKGADKDSVKPSYLNQNSFKKIIFKNSNISRGRSNKSSQLGNRNSSGEVGTPGWKANPVGGAMKIKKNPHQTIKFNKKKIHIVRSTSQNPKRSRSLSNNPKLWNSKHSDESGHKGEETGAYEETTPVTNKILNKNEIPKNWQKNGSNNEKIAALQSISKFNNTGNFNPSDFQNTNMIRARDSNTIGNFADLNSKVQQNSSSKKQEWINPISPVSTKSSVEWSSGTKNVEVNQVNTAKPSILSVTMGHSENMVGKNSGIVEAGSYNSLISHQSKSFSNAKNEKTVNSIINSKTIVPKKSKDSSGVS